MGDGRGGNSMAVVAPSQSIGFVSRPRPPPGWRARASCQPMQSARTTRLTRWRCCRGRRSCSRASSTPLPPPPPLPHTARAPAGRGGKGRGGGKNGDWNRLSPSPPFARHSHLPSPPPTHPRARSRTSGAQPRPRREWQSALGAGPQSPPPQAGPAAPLRGEERKSLRRRRGSRRDGRRPLADASEEVRSCWQGRRSLGRASTAPEEGGDGTQ